MYDVIIVGAGVAGSRLAKNLDGLDVLVIEKSRDPGLKDSGHVSGNFLSLYPDEKVLVQNDRVEIIGRSASSTIASEGITYIIDRARFGRRIRKGIDISYEFVKSVSCRGRWCEVVTSEDTYKARLVVGADGAASIVRRSAGMPSPRAVPGVFGFAEKRDPVRVYLDKRISRYFLGWRTPIGEYGVADISSPQDGFSSLQSMEGVRAKNLHYGTIPMGMVYPMKGRIVLVGDAAGMVKPVTGGGIVYSTLAADVLAGLIRRKQAKEYPKRIRGMFGREIALGMLFRAVYHKLPQPLVDAFVRMVEFRGNDFDYDFLLSFLKALLKYKIKGVGKWIGSLPGNILRKTTM